MKKYYNVNYSLLLLLLMPVMLRNNAQIALLTSLTKVLDLLGNEFNAYVQSLQTHISAQTCYLQSVLNNEFDYYERRIIVRNINLDNGSYLLWKETQNKPVRLGREDSAFPAFLLNRDGQIGANAADFEIALPILWILSRDEENRMKKTININKLASKKYRIVYE